MKNDRFAVLRGKQRTMFILVSLESA